jgi:multicomponent Na+:H+ antiporter subunit F
MVNTILYIAFAIMLLALVISVIRFLLGPCVTDRVISFDILTVTSLSFMGLLAYFSGRVIYLDIAIVYGLLSFLGIIIVARYLEKGL